MAENRGGARPGSGRKSSAAKHKGAIARAEKRIADRLPELIDRAFELAEGVEVEKTQADGTTKFYSQPPCIKAITYLMDRIMGRPTQALEHSGAGSGPLKVVIEYAETLLPEVHETVEPPTPEN
jgi:hypothetical protein